MPMRQAAESNTPEFRVAGTFFATVSIGYFSGLLHILNKTAVKSSTFLLDSYWAFFYEMSYADGFRRRALVGSALRLAEPGGGDIRLINVFAVLILAALLTLYARSFSRQEKKQTSWGLVFTLAFFLSALVSIFFEVMGDLLQISMLLFLSVAWLLRTRINNEGLRLGVAILLMVPCFLIHEGSVFCLAPCLPFLIRSRPKLKDFAVTTVIVLAFLVWSATWSQVNPQLTYHLKLLHGQTKIVDLNDVLGTPTFGQLLRQTYLVHFAGLRGKLNLTTKVLKVSALVLGGWIASSCIFSRRMLANQLYIYLCIMLFSVPFWIIAADWGRFSAYYFLLAITISLWNSSSAAAHDPAPPFVEAVVDKLEWLASWNIVRIAALVALIGSPFNGSRIYGMDLKNLLVVLLASGFAIAQILGWIDRTTPKLPTSQTIGVNSE